MEKSDLLPLLKEKIGFILLAGVFLASLSFVFLVVSQKNFRVKTDYLVVQDKDSGQDYYSLSKSVEYVTKIFNEAIYSDLFIEEAIRTEKMSNEFLPFDKKNRLKEWNKIIKTNANPEIGLISVVVYNNNKSEALRISEAISQVLGIKSYLFRGSGVNVDVRRLSGPIVENNPSLSEILLAVLGGFLTGVLLAFIRVFYFSTRLLKKDYWIQPSHSSLNVANNPDEDYLESLKQIER